jgi:hypothetical protein
VGVCRGRTQVAGRDDEMRLVCTVGGQACKESVSISQNSDGHLLPEVVNVGSFLARITFQIYFRCLRD